MTWSAMAPLHVLIHYLVGMSVVRNFNRKPVERAGPLVANRVDFERRPERPVYPRLRT